MPDFYNPNRILSLRDLDGKAPELVFVCGNRTAGKTFAFKRLLVRRFLAGKGKFVVFVRFIDDIPQVAAGFFADVGPICFPRHTLEQRPILHGKAAELFLDGRSCGYVIALNDPERIKRNSALFADAEAGFLDEFMSETGKYVPNELFKFNSIRLSIARGGARGVHARPFPVYLCSNNVTILNPYFEYYRIAERLQNKTKFLRGHGWVLEQTFNQAAADAIRENFQTVGADELAYAAGNEYLLDTRAFVSKMPGAKTCTAIIRYAGREYSIWSGLYEIYFISYKLKGTSRLVIALDNKSHDEGTVFLGRSHPYFKALRRAYDAGKIRFESQGAKSAFLAAMSIQDK